jgi:hypothetical protein
MNILMLLYLKDWIRSLFMGRPRNKKEEQLNFKEQQMEITNAPETVEEPAPVIEYNRIGLGWYINPQTGLRHLVEIPFNDQLQVGQIKVISEGDGRDIISERFRIKASEIL